MRYVQLIINGEELGKEGWADLKSPINIDGFKFTQMTKIVICGRERIRLGNVVC